MDLPYHLLFSFQWEISLTKFNYINKPSLDGPNVPPWSHENRQTEMYLAHFKWGLSQGWTTVITMGLKSGRMIFYWKFKFLILDCRLLLIVDYFILKYIWRLWKNTMLDAFAIYRLHVNHVSQYCIFWGIQHFLIWFCM